MYSFIEEVANNQANIKVIGIGGGGCNAVERMLTRQMNGVEFIACNTDMQSLQQYHAPTNLQLGMSLTRGLGAGGNPKVGRAAAFEDEEMIRAHLTGADMVFVTAGMGGGTGTGGAPVVTQIARDLGILTIAVVTLPFKFEGRRRQKIAEAGIRDLEDFVDTLIIIPNEKLLAAVEPDTTVRDAFMKADEILSNAVQGISDLITEPGEVNVDFADVRTIMTDMGKAILGTGMGEGETRAIDAVEAAISSPLLENLSINGAQGILINITSGDDLGMLEMNQACERIQQAADEDALIIFGHVTNPDYIGRIKVTVIATGFEKPKVRERSTILTNDFKGRDPVRQSYTQSADLALVQQDESAEEPDSEECLEVQLESTNPAFYPDEQSQEEIESNQESEHVEEHDSPELQSGNNSETDYDHTDTDKPLHLHLVESEFEEEPALAVSTVPIEQLERPELEISSKGNSLHDEYPSVPDYNKRDLSSGAYKKEVNLTGTSQRIYYGDINTPAFLRRKAD
ncbi:cell division protein FtsZ [bacterium]|nr:cell division protein FtsZ [bacterium]